MKFSQKIFWKYVSLIAFLFILVIIFAVVLSIEALSDPTKYAIFISFLIGFGFYPLYKKFLYLLDEYFGPVLDKWLDRAIWARKGTKGEKEVEAWLKELQVDHEFAYISNFRPDKKDGDLDFVIISDFGILVLEVKNLSGKIKFEDGVCLKKYRDGKEIEIKDPRWQINKNTKRLRQFLDNNNFVDISIRKAIVMIGDAYWEKPGVYIIQNKEGLQDYIESLYKDPNCTVEVRNKIYKLLK